MSLSTRRHPVTDLDGPSVQANFAPSPRRVSAMGGSATRAKTSGFSDICAFGGVLYSLSGVESFQEHRDGDDRNPSKALKHQ